MRSTVFLLLGVASGMPRAARAQTQLEFAPYLGLYWPTSILASGGGETLKQQRSVTLGMRVTKWWPGRLGVEGTVGYAPSPLWSSQYGFTFPAHVLTVSAKAFLRVTSPAAWAALHVGGGVGLVGHGGDAYRPWYVGPKTFVGGVANARAVMKLARWVALQLDAEDLLRAVAMAFGFPTRALDKAQLLAELEAFLVSLVPQGKRALHWLYPAKRPRAVPRVRSC